MSMKPPLIGITAANDPLVPGHYILRWDYVHGVEACGGIPVILAPTNSISCDRIMQRLDGLILSGGHDITPSIYGGNPHASIRDTSLERDEFEFGLIDHALQAGIPMLGICRGLQLLNLALGGGLIQNVPDEIDSDILHNDPERPRDAFGHQVSITPDTLLHRITRRDTIAVNSFHHQAVGAVAPRARVCAVAEDGLAEGLEIPDHPFALGIQWHPEALWRTHREFLNYFDALVTESALRIRNP